MVLSFLYTECISSTYARDSRIAGGGGGVRRLNRLVSFHSKENILTVDIPILSPGGPLFLSPKSTH